MDETSQWLNEILMFIDSVRKIVINYFDDCSKDNKELDVIFVFNFKVQFAHSSLSSENLVQDETSFRVYRFQTNSQQ